MNIKLNSAGEYEVIPTHYLYINNEIVGPMIWDDVLNNDTDRIGLYGYSTGALRKDSFFVLIPIDSGEYVLPFTWTNANPDEIPKEFKAGLLLLGVK